MMDAAKWVAGTLAAARRLAAAMAGRGGSRRRTPEAETTAEEDVRSFFAKLDAAERDVPAALVDEWRQMAAEGMERAADAQSFAFEQGRLRAYREVAGMFRDLARSYRGRPMEGEDAE